MMLYIPLLYSLLLVIVLQVQQQEWSSKCASGFQGFFGFVVRYLQSMYDTYEVPYNYRR